MPSSTCDIRLLLSMITLLLGVYHEGCDYNSAWQGYHCPDNDYSFVVWEGLDGGWLGDFLKRILGPVAVFEVNSLTVDIVNGPRSVGICHGYACLERSTLFFLLLKDSTFSYSTADLNFFSA